MAPMIAAAGVKRPAPCSLGPAVSPAVAAAPALAVGAPFEPA
jgi:hypothetical protein